MWWSLNPRGGLDGQIAKLQLDALNMRLGEQDLQLTLAGDGLNVTSADMTWFMAATTKTCDTTFGRESAGKSDIGWCLCQVRRF